jgi:hypothetical protein
LVLTAVTLLAWTAVSGGLIYLYILYILYEL